MMFGMTLGEKNKAYLVKQRGSSISHWVWKVACGKCWCLLVSNRAVLQPYRRIFLPAAIWPFLRKRLHWRDGKLQGTNGKGNIFLENLRRSLSWWTFDFYDLLCLSKLSSDQNPPVTFHTGQLIGILRMTYDTYVIGLYNPFINQPTFRTLLNSHFL